MSDQPNEIDALPPDIQASVDAAIESLKQEELAYARAFANIWEEGFLKGQEGGHQQNDNPYLDRLRHLEAEISKEE